MTAVPPILDATARVFDAMPPQQRRSMIRLRELIFETARSLEGIGKIEESLKWGQPTFSTIRPKSGSPVRIAPLGSNPGQVGLFFICSTNLVERFRQQYDGELVFETNRAIVVDPSSRLPEGELKHCIAMALRYHLDK